MFRSLSRVALMMALGLTAVLVFDPAAASDKKTPATPKEASAPKDEQIAAPQNVVKPKVGSDTGLPVPRFVSLKSNNINVRRGPGPDNQIVWVYNKKSLPVEIIAESGRWRKIRDRDGATGWVWHSMLDGRRSALISGKPGDTQPVALFSEPSDTSTIVAYAEVGVIAQLPFCQDQWCELKVNGYEGWITRNELWGTYPGENFE